jgi:hypothetical protein
MINVRFLFLKFLPTHEIQGNSTSNHTAGILSTGTGLGLSRYSHHVASLDRGIVGVGISKRIEK